MAGQFLVHVDFSFVRGDVILERDSKDWAVAYAGLANRAGWDQGKLGWWEWDTSRDACILFDNRAQKSPGVMATVGLTAGNSPFIAVSLFGFNPQAATFGYAGQAAWGSDYGKGLNGAPRGEWEIVAKPEDMAFVRAELIKLQAEIEAEYVDAAIDVIGIADPTPLSDLYGATRSIQKSDYVGAALSLVSVLPYLGDLAGKTAKGLRIAKKLSDLYARLRRVMHILQVLEEKALRARKAAREAMERAEAMRRKSQREAAQAEQRIRRAFVETVQKRYAQVARAAGWRADDLARACEWCKFSVPPKLVVARKRNPTALKFDGAPGYTPKPPEIKSLKSAKSGPHEGLYVRPDLDEIERTLGKRKRLDMEDELWDLERKGFKFGPDGVLKDKAGNKVFSDIDFMSITNVPPGRTATAWGGRLAENDDPFYVGWINDLFFQGRKNKQHGNQDRFTKKVSDAAQDVNVKPGRAPDADELRAPDAFLVIGPDGVARNVSWAELKRIYAEHGIHNPYTGL